MKLLKLTSGSGVVQHVMPDRVDSFSRGYWKPARIEEVQACGFGVGAGWHPARCGKLSPCPDHRDLKCACGKPATEGCSFAGPQFVCGRPACDRHRDNCGQHAVIEVRPRKVKRVQIRLERGRLSDPAYVARILETHLPGETITALHHRWSARTDGVC